MTSGRDNMPGTMQAKILLTLLLAATLHLPAFADESAVEPLSYRMEDYRAPVPATLQGAKVVTTDEAAALLTDKRAVFFDVMPHTPKPAKLPAGTIWREKVRNNIPGSVWLPNVGYGALSGETADYFQAALETLTGGDNKRMILFYCMTDCWMSWNAAKRAIEWGYGSVIWYPSGADGWEKGGHALSEGKPYAAKLPVQ
jgi:PQQ-dependent catabolism-associated CXXCW motif protein